MNPQRAFFKDLAFLFGAALFFVACLATSHRSPKTLSPGQVSVSGSYLRAENLDDGEGEPVQLIGAEGRVGLVRGVDFALQHTWDVSEGNDALFSTVWGDLKVQLTNRDNQIGKPIFSTGLIKGYVYDEEVEVHITSLPLMIGVPVTEQITPFASYRHEFVNDEFLPNFSVDARRWFSVGAEFALTKPSRERFTPKVGLAIGTFNSLDGSEDGDNGLTLNLGLSIDTPRP